MPAINPNKDYYTILQLSECQVPVKEIRNAYYRLAKELHPDRTGGDEAAAEQFKQVLEAYEVLSDEDLRTQYDEMRVPAAAPTPAAAYMAQTYYSGVATEIPAWVYQGYNFAGSQWGSTHPQSGAGMYQQPPQPAPTAAYYHYNQQPKPHAPPDPQRPQYSSPPTSRVDRGSAAAFRIYPFSHYYDENFQEKLFLPEIRAYVESERTNLHKAQEQLLIARRKLEDAYNSSTVDDFARKKLGDEYAMRLEWKSLCKEELKKREALLVGHEARAAGLLQEELRTARIRNVQEQRLREARELAQWQARCLERKRQMDQEMRMQWIVEQERQREMEMAREMKTEMEMADEKEGQRQKEMRRASVKSEVEAGNVEVIEIDD